MCSPRRTVSKINRHGGEMRRRNVPGVKVLSWSSLRLQGSVFTQPENLPSGRRYVTRPDWRY